MTALTAKELENRPLARLSVEQAHQRWQAGSTLLLDSRAASHFAMAHVLGAIHIDQDNWLSVIQPLAYKMPMMVMCYHGISSQGVVIKLLQQGFSTVHNIQGGFERWAAEYPRSIVYYDSCCCH